MTDQALASRLDELSMLQEIDRQLNTSLDIKRVLDLTLEWGLRMTDATAGSMGLVNREEKHDRSYWRPATTPKPTVMPLDNGLAGAVARSGNRSSSTMSHRIRATSPDRPTTRSQMSVPLKREHEVIGVMNLESTG